MTGESLPDRKRGKLPAPFRAPGFINDWLSSEAGHRELIEQGRWEIPERLGVEIAHHLPDIKLAELRRLAVQFLLSRFDPPNSIVREELKAVAREARRLHRAHASLSGLSRTTLISAASAQSEPAEQNQMALQADRIATAIANLAERAAASIDAPRGAPRSALVPLVHEAAALVKEAGYPVNARPNGPLVRLVGIVIEAAEQPQPADLTRTVRSALAKKPETFLDSRQSPLWTQTGL